MGLRIILKGDGFIATYKSVQPLKQKIVMKLIQCEYFGLKNKFESKDKIFFVCRKNLEKKTDKLQNCKTNLDAWSSEVS